MSDIKQEVLDLAAKLKSGLPVAKDGTTSSEEGLFEKTVEEGIRAHLTKELNDVLPEGAPLAILQAGQKHKTTFIAAAGHAFGSNSLDVMKKNAELNQTSVSIPTIGKDSIDLSFQRSVTSPNPAGGEAVTKYGRLSVKVNEYGAGSRGQLLKVKQELSEKAAAVFGG